LSKECTCGIDLPWPFPFTFGRGQPDWDCYVFTVCTPQRVDGLTVTLPIMDVYASYSKIELETLVPQGKVNELPPGPLSLALSYASVLAGMVPHPFASSVSKAAQVGASLAAMLGYSRPVEQAQTINVIRKVGNMALGSGQPDFSEQLGLDPNVSRNVNVPYIPLKQPDETSIYAHCRSYGQLRSEWTAGTALAADPCCLLGSAGTGAFYPTRLGYFSAMFKYWTGSFKLKIVVVGSPLVRWRIGINIVPPTETLPVAFVDNGSMLAYVVEVLGTTEAEIDVPYLHQRPWQANALSFSGTVDTSKTRVVYFSLTPAQGPSPTPVYPKVMAFLKGGADYQVAVPMIGKGSPLQAISFQPTTAITFGPTLEEGRAVETFGEVVEDIICLAKRSVHSGTFYFTGTGKQACVYPCDGFQVVQDGQLVGPGLTSFNSAMTYFQYVRGPFLGYSGGSCVKFAFSDAGSATTPGMISQPFMGGWGYNLQMNSALVGFDYSSNGCTMFELSDAPLMEMSNPDRCDVHFKNPITYTATLSTTPPITTSYFVYSLQAFPTADPQWSYEVFLSARDDFMVGGFLCCPTLYVLGS